jgi:hypothetical protein
MRAIAAIVSLDRAKNEYEVMAEQYRRLAELIETGRRPPRPESLTSLLDLPLWIVPPFEDMLGRGDRRVRTSGWLTRMLLGRIRR